MKKMALIGMLAVVMASSASAAPNMLTNGDFGAGASGWTEYKAPWGDPQPGINTASGAAVIGGGGSGGLYQVVSAAPGTTVTLTGDWSGAAGGGGWIEVMLFNVYESDGIDPANVAAFRDSYLDAATWPEPDIAGRIGINQRIVNKRSSWGNDPLENTPASGQFQNNLITGNGGTPDRGNYMGTNSLVVGPDGIVAVSVKAGGSATCTYDNLVLTPEPAAALLLGLPLLFVRRRRA